MPIESQNSPNYAHYLKILEDIFRHDGIESLEAVGVVCYLSFDRSYVKNKDQTAHDWFSGDASFDVLPGKMTKSQAEEVLSNHYRFLWLTHIRGVRHDYYFYSRTKSIEETIDLIEVAKVMTS